MSQSEASSTLLSKDLQKRTRGGILQEAELSMAIRSYFSSPSLCKPLAPLHLSSTVISDFSSIASNFFIELNNRCQSNNIEDAIEFVIDKIDDMVGKKGFKQCDYIVSKINERAYPESIIHSILSATRPARRSMKSRSYLIIRFKEKIAKRTGEKEAEHDTVGYY